MHAPSLSLSRRSPANASARAGPLKEINALISSFSATYRPRARCSHRYVYRYSRGQLRFSVFSQKPRSRTDFYLTPPKFRRRDLAVVRNYAKDLLEKITGSPETRLYVLHASRVGSPRRQNWE